MSVPVCTCGKMTSIGCEHTNPHLRPSATMASARLIGVPICPDLLDLSVLGEADTPRGRLIRAFFEALGPLKDG